MFITEHQSRALDMGHPGKTSQRLYVGGTTSIPSLQMKKPGVEK